MRHSSLEDQAKPYPTGAQELGAAEQYCLGKGGAGELKAGPSPMVSTADAAFVAFLPGPQMLSRHEVLVSCPRQALANVLPRPQVSSSADSLILWEPSGYWAQTGVGWNPGSILFS